MYIIGSYSAAENLTVATGITHLAQAKPSPAFNIPVLPTAQLTVALKDTFTQSTADENIYL